MRFKLVVFDMDGVIFADDSFWTRVHHAYGTEHPGFELTEKYLKTNIKKLADEVIGKLWKGKDASLFFELVRTAEYNIGVKEVFAGLKQAGIKTCILTSGPVHLAKRAQEELGIDRVYGNEIKIKNGIITGEYSWLSLDYSHKGETFLGICRDFGVKPSETVAVGDNEQDISKFEKAGFSIAFNSHSKKIKEAADAVVEGNDLRGILQFIN